MELTAEFDRLTHYIALLLIVTVISVTLVGAGFYLGGIGVADRLLLKSASTLQILRVAGPGIALQALGVLVWSIGTVAALYSVLYEQFTATMERDLASDDLEASVRNTVGNRVDDIQAEFDDMRRQLQQQDRDERK